MASPKASRVESARAALLALDEHLFNPHPSAWLVIDAGNSKVSDASVTSLRSGLAALGRGRIAAVVGRTRHGVQVVDVDVNGGLGTFIAHEVAGWLHARGCWALVRPSGGAEGRHHVFLAHAARPDTGGRQTGLPAALRAYLRDLAGELKVPASALDLRDAVRPLSSPHRLGQHPMPCQDPDEALADLQRVLPTSPVPSPVRRTDRERLPGQPGNADAAADAAAALVPLPRAGRALLPQWATYLRTGRPPADDAGVRADGGATRSLTEAGLTLELVWAGYRVEEAWGVITTAHPRAMRKARSQGRTWWVRYVWNTAVTDSIAFNTHPRTTRLDQAAPPELAAAVDLARQALSALAWSLPARQRPSVLLVAHRILDRVLLARTARVPCPERDLVLDTGLASRRTVRAALGVLDGRIGRLHTDCLSRSDRESTSYEFEVDEAVVTGWLENAPPVASHPPPRIPPPPVPPGLWVVLPRSSHSLWRALLASTQAVRIEHLATLATLTETPAHDLTRQKQRTMTHALEALRAAGLVDVDGDGGWSSSHRPCDPGLLARAATAHEEQRTQVEAERAAYRAPAAATWSSGRARAMKAQLARQKGWWDNLDPEERAGRLARRRLAFDQLPLAAQATLKADLAQRRAAAGHLEREHHATWLAELSPDAYLHRTLERQERFRRRSPAARALAVATWETHRQRFGVPRAHAPVPPPQPDPG